MVKYNYSKNPNKLKLNKVQVVNRNLHEIKEEILRDYISEFEMVGKLSIGDQIRATHIRFRNNNDYECFFNAIDQN